MKKIALLFLFSIVILKASAQMPLDSVTKRFVYEGVVKADSLNSEIIFKHAKEWLVRNLKSTDNNVNLDDKDSKSLTATGNLPLDDRSAFCSYKEMNLNFKFSVFVKEGRYKYIVENFFYSYIKVCDSKYGGNTSESGAFEKLNFNKGKNQKVYEEANGKINALISDLEKYIKSSSGSKKNDW